MSKCYLKIFFYFLCSKQLRYGNCGVCWVIWSSGTRYSFLMPSWQLISNLQHERKNWLQLLPMQDRCHFVTQAEWMVDRLTDSQVWRQTDRHADRDKAWGGVFASLLHRLQVLILFEVLLFVMGFVKSCQIVVSSCQEKTSLIFLIHRISKEKTNTALFLFFAHNKPTSCVHIPVIQGSLWYHSC